MSRNNIIWSNDIDDLWNDEDYQRDQYEFYLDQFEWSHPKEEIDPSVLTRSNYDDEYVDPDEEQPLSFEEWLEDDFYTDYDLMQIEADNAKEDLENNVCPMIEKQLNGDALFILGSRSGWRAGSGGWAFRGTDEFVDSIYNRNYDNYSELVKNSDNSISYYTTDHDGSTSGDLYTLPTDDARLLEIAKKFTDIVSDIQEFDYADDYDSSLTEDELIVEMFKDRYLDGDYDLDDLIYEGISGEYLVPIEVKW